MPKKHHYHKENFLTDKKGENFQKFFLGIKQKFRTFVTQSQHKRRNEKRNIKSANSNSRHRES